VAHPGTIAKLVSTVDVTLLTDSSPTGATPTNAQSGHSLSDTPLVDTDTDPAPTAPPDAPAATPWYTGLGVLILSTALVFGAGYAALTFLGTGNPDADVINVADIPNRWYKGEIYTPEELAQIPGPKQAEYYTVEAARDGYFYVFDSTAELEAFRTTNPDQ
jgi:hypothetical protein